MNTNQGNNAFSYKKRKENTGNAQIHISTLHDITDIQEVKVGDSIVFEEIDHHGTLQSCYGLEHLYRFEKQGVPICYIFDNHNHALSFWGEYYIHSGLSLPVIHIDQHSDLGVCGELMLKDSCNSLEYIHQFATRTCNVGNFINPALEVGIIDSCSQVRTQTTLLTFDGEKLPDRYILDIDLDFRAPEMGIEHYKQSIEKTKYLCRNAQLITVATSPFFLEQNTALRILHDLFE